MGSRVNPEPEDVRRYSCAKCMGEFFLREGIDPHFCPHCGGSIRHIETKDFGEYRE